MRTKNMLVVLALVLIAGTASAQTATAPAGDGSPGNPYQVATLDNLDWVTQNSTSWDKAFVQTANLDATASANWELGRGLSPIGNNNTPFTGVYHGANHRITGLYIHRPMASWVGLFGWVGSFSGGGTIENLVLDQAQVAGGSSNVGGLIGALWLSLASNCGYGGSVSGNTSVGGLVGEQWNS